MKMTGELLNYHDNHSRITEESPCVLQELLKNNLRIA